MKILERVYYTLLLLSLANAIITPFFFERQHNFKYDRIEDIPAMQVMGWSLLTFAVLGIIGILYQIWYDKSRTGS